MAGNLYYFVSDVHLGLDYKNPVGRERMFVRFLESLPADTKDLYLLGDIFDFWYEYKDVIPRGFTRTLGALASLADRGVKIHFFNGNHDIWTYGYFRSELGFIMEKQPAVIEIEGRRFCLGHGDGLWDASAGYTFLQKVFRCRFLQILFSAIHPRWAFLFGHKWSKHNRLTHPDVKKNGKLCAGAECGAVGDNVRRESAAWAAEFQKGRPEGEKVDFFVFGHHHVVVDRPVEGGHLFILGDWINNPDCLVFNGDSCTLTDLGYLRNIEK